MGKITKIFFQKMCPSIQNRKELCWGICKCNHAEKTKKTKKRFMKMYLNITKTCMANVLLLHLMILLQNVYITTLCRGKRAIFIRKWVDCGIVSIGQLLGANGYLTYNEFKTRFQTVNTIRYMRVYWLQLSFTKRNWV